MIKWYGAMGIRRLINRISLSILIRFKSNVVLLNIIKMDIMLLDLNRDVMGDIVSYLDGASLYCLRMTCKELNKSIKREFLSTDDVFRLFFEDLYTNFNKIYTYYPDEMVFKSHRRQRNIRISTDDFNKSFTTIPTHIDDPKKYLTVSDQISGHLYFNFCGSSYPGRFSGYPRNCRMGFRGNFHKGFTVGCMVAGENKYINFKKY